MRVEGSGLRDMVARDSLREEIFQNLNENLAEHEVVTWTVTGVPLTAYGIQNDTMKVERVTDRTRFQVLSSKTQDSKMMVNTEVIRDTVYVERKDSIQVKSEKLKVNNSLTPHLSSLLIHLKWIFFIICAIIGLIITIKICWRKVL